MNLHKRKQRVISVFLMILMIFLTAYPEEDNILVSYAMGKEETIEQTVLKSGTEVNELIKGLDGKDGQSVKAIMKADRDMSDGESIQLAGTGSLVAWVAEGILYFYGDGEIFYGEDVSGIWSGLSSLEDISGLSDINLSGTTDISGMFEGDSSLSDLTPISNYFTDNVKKADRLFFGCEKLSDISAINVHPVTESFTDEDGNESESVCYPWNIAPSVSMEDAFTGTSVETMPNWYVDRSKDISDTDKEDLAGEENIGGLTVDEEDEDVLEANRELVDEYLDTLEGNEVQYREFLGNMEDNEDMLSAAAPASLWESPVMLLSSGEMPSWIINNGKKKLVYYSVFGYDTKGRWGTWSYSVTDPEGTYDAICIAPELAGPDPGTYTNWVNATFYQIWDEDMIKSLYYGYGGQGTNVAAQVFQERHGYWSEDASLCITHTAVSYIYHTKINSQFNWSYRANSTLQADALAYVNRLYSLSSAPKGSYVVVLDTNHAGKQFLAYVKVGQKGQLNVHKSSANRNVTNDCSAYSLGGAVFGVYADSGCTQGVGTLTTNESGDSNALELDPGTYYVKELQASPGYMVNSTVQSVCVSTGNTSTVEVSEPPFRRGVITITKRDSVFGDLLGGAEFTLQKWNSSTASYSNVKILSYIGNGQYTTEDIFADASNPDGRFRIMETKAPEHYSGSYSKEFTLGDDAQTITDAMTNTHEPFTIEIKKYDNDNDSILLPGATFVVYEYNVSTKQYDTTGTTFKYNSDTKRYTASVMPTKQNGGYFRIVEKTVPDGYEGTWSKDIRFTASSSSVCKIDVGNALKRIKGQVMIDKTDADDGANLTDAVFCIYEFDANAGSYKTEPCDTLEYNDNTGLYESAYLLRNDRAFDKSRNDGKYKIVEYLPPDGYVNGVWDPGTKTPGEAWSQEIEIEGNGDFETIQIFSVDVTNKKNEYHIKKTSADSQTAVNGAVFRIRKTAGEGSDVKAIINGEDETLTAEWSEYSVVNGEILLTRIAPGSYEFQEISAPAGYAMDKNVYSFTVTSDGKISGRQSVTKVIRNMPVRDLQIIKYDSITGKTFVEDSNFPSGTRFSVYEWSTSENAYKTSPYANVMYADGDFVDMTTLERVRLLYSDDNEGKFKAAETASSAGYIMDGTELEFILPLESSGESYKIEFTNEPNRFVLKKTDASGNTLTGVHFDVWKSDGVETLDVVTGTDGTATILRLQPGTWNYQETQTLAGYALDDKIYQFTVSEDGRIEGNSSKEVTVTDSRESIIKIKKKDSLTGLEYEYYSGFPAGTEFDIYEWNEEKQDYESVPYIHVVSVNENDMAETATLTLSGETMKDSPSDEESVYLAPACIPEEPAVTEQIAETVKESQTEDVAELSVASENDSVMLLAADSWSYGYTGAVQTFTAPYDGTFQLEVYGAQGGTAAAYESIAAQRGGYGGYAKGTISLTRGQKIYIYVGGAGSACSSGTLSGGYNGGGGAISNDYGTNGSGGGATHMATTARGVLSNYYNYRGEVLLVAGGGGGGHVYYWPTFGYYLYGVGGNGGGTTGGSGGLGGSYLPGTDVVGRNASVGGGQTVAAYTTEDGAVNAGFGRGGQGYNTTVGWTTSAGGGGGWMGGTHGGNYSGGGGSGYVNTGKLSSSSTATSTKTGNGSAKITTVSQKTYTLTMKPNGGTYNGSTGDYVVASTASPALTSGLANYCRIGTPTRDGYTFAGWYTAASGGTKVYDSAGNAVKGSYWSDTGANNGLYLYSGNLTVYAHWIPNVVRTATGPNDLTSYYVYAYVNSGASRVQFPSWTTANGQDDLLSDWTTNTAAKGTSGSWTIDGLSYNYRFLVKRSDHNNEAGAYQNHVYAFTADGYTMKTAPTMYCRTMDISGVLDGELTDVTSPAGKYTLTVNGLTVQTNAADTLQNVFGKSTYTITPAENTGYIYRGYWVYHASAASKEDYVTQTFHPASVGDVISGTVSNTSSELYIILKYNKVYDITYDLSGGQVSGNPRTFDRDSETITLKNPTRAGYTFAGWIGSNGDTPQMTVTIPKGSAGNKSYTACWAANVLFVDEDTDEYPVIRETELNKGKFKIVETKSTDGYIMDGQTAEVRIDDAVDGVIEAEFENDPNAVQIWKVNGSGTALEGAVFKVWKAGSTEKKMYTTDENGLITLNRLSPGTWYYQETAAPEGYERDTAVYTIEVNTDGKILGSNTQRVYNLSPETKWVILYKKDQYGKAISGVRFRVVLVKGDSRTVLATLTTNGYGTVSYHTADITSGTLEFEEVDTPSGYIAGSSVSTTVTDGIPADHYLTAINEQNSVLIKKTDESENPLSGVIFDIWKEGESRTEYTTGADGLITLKGLGEGIYYYQEKSSLQGYKPDNTIRSFLVHSDGKIDDSVSKTYTVKNFSNSCTITKYGQDGSIKSLQSGVKFHIWNDNKGTYAFDRYLTTDSLGQIVLSALPDGIYHIKETTTAPGYVAGDEISVFTVENGMPGETEMEIINFKNALTILKTGENGMPLEKVKFRLFYTGAEEDPFADDGIYTTDKDGQITFTGLPAGEYSFVETQTQEGYDLNRMTYTFKINEEGDIITGDGEYTSSGKGNGIYRISNDFYPTADVTVVKTDVHTGTVLSGAEFELQEWDGTKYVSMSPVNQSTYSDGSYTFRRVQATETNGGMFRVVETKCPAGYAGIFTQEFCITQKNKHYELNMEAVNEANSVVFQKVDGEGNPLSGVAFYVWWENDEKGEYFTDTDGCVHLEKLTPGTWHYQEKEALDGYYPNETVYDFTVAEDGRINGEIHADLGEVVNEAVHPAFGTVSVQKTDENGNILENVIFHVYEYSNSRKDYSDSPVQTLEFDAKTGCYETVGNLTATEENTGRFKIVEEKAPAGYVANFEKEIRLDTRERDLQEISFSVKNEPNKVIIRKTDEKGNPLSGVSFLIRRTSFGIDFTERTCKTDLNGKIEISKLPFGEYEIVETDTAPGYALANTTHAFSVNGDGYIISEGNAVESLTVTETNYPNQVTIRKTNTSKEPLPGAVFQVYSCDEDGNITVSYDSLTTDTNGQITLNKVPDGVWFYQEIIAPAGYELDDTRYRFEVSGGLITEEYDDDPVPEYTFEVVDYRNGEAHMEIPEGEFLIEKRDAETKELLKGAEFAAYPFDSTDSEFDMKNAVAFIYDSERQQYVNAAPLVDTNRTRGRYLIVETKAPSGYAATFKKEINIRTDRCQMTGDDAVFNARNSLTIHKIDGDTGEPLANVSFYIWKEGDTEKKTVTTDSSGNATVTGLDSNSKYYIEEVKALEGYRGDLEIHSVSVESNGYINSSPDYICEIKNYAYRHIVVTKKIKSEDINFSNEDPTFLLTVTGRTKSGDWLTLNKAVTFTEEYVDSNTDADGYAAIDVTFDVPSGTYSVSEGETIRYRLEEIAQVENGIVSGESVYFDLTCQESGSAVFVNKKYEYRNYSSSAKVVNHFKSK